MGELSITHWLVVLVVLIVLFGPARLPQLGSSLGAAIRNFKKSLHDEHESGPSLPPGGSPPNDSEHKNLPNG